MRGGEFIYGKLYIDVGTPNFLKNLVDRVNEILVVSLSPPPPPRISLLEAILC